MALWRCYNCINPKSGMGGVDFRSEVPVCPKCELDRRTEDGAKAIVKLEVIHFDPPHGKLRNKGKNYIACNPNKKVGSSMTLYATGHHGSVTCDKCIATEAYRTTLPEGEEVVVEDVLINVNEKGIVSHEPLNAPDEFQEAGCCG